MKKFFYIILASCSLVTMISSCKEYDDSSLQSWVESLDDRVTTLENTVNNLNANIVSITEIVKSLQASKIVQSVTETADGFRIVFNDNSYIDIKNGQDGLNGQNGSDGKDGSIPQIGIEMIDGIYYWTITIDGVTTYLYGTDGHMLPVPANGKDGPDGADGLVPIFNIDASGYWTVSYDGGYTYTYIYDSYGNLVSAESGSNGDPSSSITYTDYGDYVAIYFPNGGYVYLDKNKPFYITINQMSNLHFSNHKCTVSYTITGADTHTSIQLLEKGNIYAQVKSNSSTNGMIEIEALGPVDASTKLLVFLCNDKRTVTRVLTFSNYNP